MKILKRFTMGLLGLVLLLCVVALFLPRIVTVERSAQINSPASEIYPQIASLKATAKWSPWMKLDPEMQVAYSGPEMGVGARSDWKSDHPNVGNGSQEIVEAIENEMVAMQLQFDGQGGARATIVLAESGAETNVTWGFSMDTGFNPIARYFGVMLDGWVGADYEKGLANLKSLMET